ncbi:hypothetical protein RDI58_026936 [Solanum bulbocastanum]|uniref:Uncharacterized protein n=1 Tax=Solanum bulbocastanum TaxID=147425 RepID=A0AAN8SWT8_SOLBU
MLNKCITLHIHCVETKLMVDCYKN